MLFAQLPPGTEEAVKAAASRGWEAVALVIIVLGGFSGAAFMFRYYAQQAATREERLSARIAHLEDLIHTRLFTVIDNSAQIMAQMMEQSARLTIACDRIVLVMDRFDDRMPTCMAMEAVERAKLVDALVANRVGKA